MEFEILREIINEVRLLKNENKLSLVIFDLDSTLFDVSPRLKRILLDFAHDKNYQSKFPQETRTLLNVETHTSDWGITRALERLGLDKAPAQFHEEIKKFWRHHFFTNEYLDYDHPYEGAVDFVNHLLSEGAQIAYLTGRDQHRMKEGSIKTLQKWGFPLNMPNAQLILKPHKDMDDALFKKDWIEEQEKLNFDKIWFFENEPVNTNLVRRHLPEIQIVFFDSTHAGIEDPHHDYPKINHYRKKNLR